MAQMIDTNRLDWQSVRPELTQGVRGKTLLDGPTKIVLTWVAPGGVFPPHRDAYGHLFHFLAGVGLAQLGEQWVEVGPGICLQVEAGELHGYENTGSEGLLLISANLPAG